MSTTTNLAGMSEIGNVSFQHGEMKLFLLADNAANQWDETSDDKIIDCKLELSITERCYIRGLWVKLSGKAVAQGNPLFAETSVDLLTDADDFHKNGIYRIFLGFGEHDNDADQLVSVEPGEYAWPCSFSLASSWPLSFHDSAASVKYQLRAQFDCPNLPAAITQVRAFYYYLLHMQ